MKVISLNTNGIRAASRKGVFDYIKREAPDFVCIQETKAQAHQLTDELFHPEGYFCHFVDAEKKGYSGVAIYSRFKPKSIDTQLGWHTCDNEGRFIQFNFDKLSVASLYLPSGTSGAARQTLKYEFLDNLLPHLKEIANSDRGFILCGDWNIAHKNIDLKNWKSNQKNSGFLPEERAWLDTVFNDLGMIDSFREINHDAEQYTFWSNRGQAWANNVGWRIDYQIINPILQKFIQKGSIYKQQRFSDHAPLTIQYDKSLKKWL